MDHLDFSKDLKTRTTEAFLFYYFQPLMDTDTHRCWRVFVAFGSSGGMPSCTLRVPLLAEGRPTIVFALVNKFTTPIQPWT